MLWLTTADTCAYSTNTNTHTRRVIIVMMFLDYFIFDFQYRFATFQLFRQKLEYKQLAFKPFDTYSS